LRGADSGNPGGADLLPLRRCGGCRSRSWSWSWSQTTKQLAELLFKGINALFDICCPT
jgi:hypothetical protein